MTAAAAAAGREGGAAGAGWGLLGRDRVVGPCGAGVVAADGCGNGELRIQQQGRRWRQPRTGAAWPLFETTGGGGDAFYGGRPRRRQDDDEDDEDQAAADEEEHEIDGDGESGVGGLLFGDPEGEGALLDLDGEEVQGKTTMEVDEEDLREEWIARGLDPEAFDPLSLLQMWEQEDMREVCAVCVWVCVCVFFCPTASSSSSGSSSSSAFETFVMLITRFQRTACLGCLSSTPA